jgi:uncharacterized protein
MVHTFRCLGRYFAVDTESGSVFETDEPVKMLIDERNSPTPTEAGEFSRFTADDIETAKREIDDLVRENILFSAKPIHEPLEFNGEIKSVCLNVSHKCNLKCAYCFADGGDYGGLGAHMPQDVALAAIDYLVARSGKKRNLEVDFFGGEPLLNFAVVRQTVADARELEKTRGKRFLFTLTTNALLLTESVTEFLNREMDNVVVSIDGREEVHNSVRRTAGGADSFQIALQNAKAFRAARGDKNYYIRGTFTAKNLDFARDAAALFDEGFDRISLEPVVLDPAHPLALTEAHVPAVLAEYEKLAGEYLNRRAAGDWVQFFHFNVDIYNGPCLNKRLKSCGAGCEYIAVTPDGEVYPCHQFAGLSAYAIGNVTTGRYEKTVPLTFSSRNQIAAKKQCGECWAKYYCGGGCAASSVKLTGRLTEPYPVSCTLMKKRVECALAINAIENE